jgi:hypothetical protein
MATFGPNIAGTGADLTGVGTITWSSPTSIQADDGTSAQAILSGTTSHYLKATNFGFSIPTGATVNGIWVEWKKNSPGGLRITDTTIKIVKAGSVGGNNNSAGTNWNLAGYQGYGGFTDLWGLTWSPSDINDSTFGAVMSCSATSGESSVTANVDACRITVYYTVSTIQTLTVNGTSGTEAAGWQAEGGNYTRLQVDDGDTTRLYTPTNGDTYYVTLTDTSGLGGATINSLTVYAKVKSLDPVSNTVQIGVKVAGTDYYSGTFDTNPSQSYILYSYTWLTNPATGTAWTASAIDAVEIGLKKTNASGMGWTYAYAEVDYSPGGIANKALLVRQAAKRSTLY